MMTRNLVFVLPMYINSVVALGIMLCAFINVVHVKATVSFNKSSFVNSRWDELGPMSTADGTPMMRRPV
jgi:hypothetical protein